MGFFEDFGNLMKKYNLEIHSIQLDDNIRIMNERFRLSLKKEDLPPPIFIFRTSEGDFVPSIFGPVTLNNEEHNIKFTNISNGSQIVLFPAEQKKEEPPQTGGLSEEEAAHVVKTLNALGDAIQNNMEWEVVEETPKTEEPQKEKTKKQRKKKMENDKNYLIISNIFSDNSKEVVSYGDFISKNVKTLQHFDTLANLYNKNVESKQNVELKLTSKEGKQVLKKIEEELDKFNCIVALPNYKKSNIAKRVVKDLKARGVKIIEEKDFK